MTGKAIFAVDIKSLSCLNSNQVSCSATVGQCGRRRGNGRGKGKELVKQRKESMSWTVVYKARNYYYLLKN